MPFTNVSSIFSRSTVRSRSKLNDDWPVPKPSIDTRTPASRIALITYRLRSGWLASALSVISSSRRAGLSVASSSALNTLDGKRRSCRFLAETFTDRRMSNWSTDRGIGGRLRQHELRQRADQIGVLGQRDEVTRRHVPERRVLPAQERLHRLGGSVDEPCERLVVHPQLIAADRVGQLAEQAESTGRRSWPGRVATLDSRAVPLGAVHRRVGCAQQVVGSGPVGGHEGQADAHPDREWKAVDDDRSDELIAKPLDHLQRRLLRADLGEQHRELVATDAGHDCRVGRGPCELVSDPDQHLVAGLMTELIVDAFEAVEVHQQHRATRVVGLRIEEAAEMVVERASIEQMGEPVVIGLVRTLQCLLRCSGTPAAPSLPTVATSTSCTRSPPRRSATGPATRHRRRC